MNKFLEQIETDRKWGEEALYHATYDKLRQSDSELAIEIGYHIKGDMSLAEEDYSPIRQAFFAGVAYARVAANILSAIKFLLNESGESIPLIRYSSENADTYKNQLLVRNFLEENG